MSATGEIEVTSAGANASLCLPSSHDSPGHSPRPGWRARARGLATPALALALSGAAAIDARLLFSQPLPVGENGYYFARQAAQIARSGRVFFPTHFPGFLYLVALLGGLAGSPARGLKLAELALHAALALAIFVLARRLIGSPWCGVMAAAMTALGGARMYLISEFPAELCGVTLLAWAAVLWWSAALSRRRRAAALGLLALAAWTQFAVLPLALALGGCGWLALRIARGRRGRLAAAACLAIWISPAVLSRVARVRAYASPAPAWPAGPILARAAILFLLCAAGGTLAWMVRARRPPVAAVCGLGGAALFTLLALLNPFIDFQSAVFSGAARLAGLGYLFAAWLATGVAWLLWRRTRLWALGPAILVIGWFAGVAATLPGLQPELLANRAWLVAALRARGPEIPAAAMILAPRVDIALIAATLDRPVAEQPLPGHPPARVLYLLDAVPPRMAGPEVILLRASQDGTAMALVPQDALRRGWDVIDAADRIRLARLNPWLPMPTAAPPAP